MKFIAKILLVIIVINSVTFSSIAYAKEKVDIKKLLPKISEDTLVIPDNDTESTEKTQAALDSPEVAALSSIPDVSAEQLFSFVIKTILEWSMILTIIAIVMAAIYYIQSLGNEEDLSKVKNIIIYLIIGMAIIAAAYGIISGVSQFNFFKAVE